MFENFEGANREENKTEPKKYFEKFESLLEGKNNPGRIPPQYQVKKLQKQTKKMLSIPPKESKVNSIKKYFVALSSRAETAHPTDGSENHLRRKRFGDKCDLDTDSSNKIRKRILQTVPNQSGSGKEKEKQRLESFP